MKNFRRILVIAFVALFAFASTSCHKDGVFNPKKKISRVFTQYNGGSKNLAATYVWNKNKLEKIDYGDGDIAYYTYDGKKVSKISNGAVVMNFTYDGAKLSKVEISYEGQLYCSVAVTHDGNKITKLVIVITEYDSDYKDAKDIVRTGLSLRGILPATTCDNLVEKQIQAKESGRKGTYTSTIEFKYDGWNIIEERWVEDNDVYAYTYDKGNNPFFGLFGGDGDYVDLVESKNNIEKVSNTYNGEYSESFFQYSYDGKWPTERRRVYSDNSLGTTYFYEYYEYVK